MTRQDFIPLARFIEKHYEPATKWGRKLLLDYIGWAANNNFLFVARNNDESISGAALARPVAKLPKIESEFDPNGRIVHVDCMIATDNRAFQVLGYAILNSNPNCDSVAFQRLKRGTRIRTYSSAHVRNTLLKLRNQYGQK